MPELLAGLEQLARERSDSLQRASRELAGEPEGFSIITRELCKFVELLSDFWHVMEARCRNGGVPAKRLVHQCDWLLGVGEVSARHLALVVKVWHERSLPASSAQPTYESVRSSQDRLNALMGKVRKTREWAVAPSRIAADLEEVKKRIVQADEGREWMRIADVVSRMRQESPPIKE